MIASAQGRQIPCSVRKRPKKGVSIAKGRETRGLELPAPLASPTENYPAGASWLLETAGWCQKLHKAYQTLLLPLIHS